MKERLNCKMAFGELLTRWGDVGGNTLVVVWVDSATLPLAAALFSLRLHTTDILPSHFGCIFTRQLQVRAAASRPSSLISCSLAVRWGTRKPNVPARAPAASVPRPGWRSTRQRMDARWPWWS